MEQENGCCRDELTRGTDKYRFRLYFGLSLRPLKLGKTKGGMQGGFRGRSFFPGADVSLL